MRVLVVEDARLLADAVVEGLRDEGMAVDVAYDGLQAAAKLNLTPYEVIVLDRDLPGVHGDVLCRMIADSEEPAMILMLTAADAPAERVTGLSLGADDYLSKPFHFPELVLRVRALARRRPGARRRTLRAAGIELDPGTRAARREGRPLDLSLKEVGVLEALLTAGPSPVSAERLLQQVWDENADPFSQVVKTTVSRLRHKLRDPPVIETVPGVGYRIAGIADGEGRPPPAGAVLLTFDNLGEAADLERGTWPHGAALGRHPSVTRALPWLLDELGRHRLTATFFVEAINCELYPGEVGEIAARGHDLGVHGWRHEPWSTLPPPRERELLARATAAFQRLGRAPRGFRPPGGEPTALTESLLRELGYTWWSPSRPVSRSAAGTPTGGAPASRPAAEARPATVAFDWELVDAYFLMERFAGLRRRRHDPPAPVAPAALGDRFAARLSADPGPEPLTLVLHPFLMLDDAWREQVARLLALLAGRRRDGRTAVVDGTAFATPATAGASG